jgi:hypothetical protein
LAFQKRDRIPNRNSHLAQKHSLPHLRTSTASSHSEKDFWSGFSQDPRRESIERNTPTPVPFDDVVIPTVYRKLQEQSHEELCFDSEQQALEYERKLKATQKWYEAQQRRKNEALYSKQRSASVAAIPTPPPRQQPTPPEKAPIRTASVREARSPGMHHHGSSPSLATERRGRGSDAYPTPPSSGYYQKTTQFDDPTSPFAQASISVDKHGFSSLTHLQSRPAEGSVLVPQRQVSQVG